MGSAQSKVNTVRNDSPLWRRAKASLIWLQRHRAWGHGNDICAVVRLMEEGKDFVDLAAKAQSSAARKREDLSNLEEQVETEMGAGCV